jgi:ribonuclease G
MKGSVVALGKVGQRQAAALIVDGMLEDFLIDPVEGTIPAPGAIFRAICDRPLKGQGGMMLRLPDGSAFLRSGKGLRPGQPLLVQVTGFAEAGKALPVTTRILFKSKYAIVTPAAPGINISRSIKDDEERVRLLEIAHDIMHDLPDAGLILRSAATDGKDEEIADDILAMLELSRAVLGDAEGDSAELLVDGADAHTLAWRDWASVADIADGDGAFDDHGVFDMIENLKTIHVHLDGGAFAFIEPTHALVSVDVNTGGDTSVSAGLKANIALARQLPRQLRCRGLGGQITIDFAPTAKKDRRQLEQILKVAFRADSIETALVGWTTLGHFELQRKRERLPVVLET